MPNETRTTQWNSRAVGIDLGTTNCVVAALDPAGEIVLYRDPTTDFATTPSCLFKCPADMTPPDGNRYVVGLEAAGRMGTAPEPIRSIKSRMGNRVEVQVTDEMMSPEQVSSYYLREMRRQIETTVAAFDRGTGTGWIVDRAIVTVPAYFSQDAVDATRRAAQMAGFELLELLAEPTAAALHHCRRTGTSDGIFMVYDFGGGTFDVSIVRVEGGSPQVIGLSGNTQLGGDQIDEAIAEHIWQSLEKQGRKLDLVPGRDAEDRLRWQQLKGMGEKVKKAISDKITYPLRDELKDRNGARVLVEMSFARPARTKWVSLTPVEQTIYDVAKRTIPYCDVAVADACKKAGITLDMVDAIILAGGSTHIPLVRQMVRNELCRDFEPEYLAMLRNMQEKDKESKELENFVARKQRARAAEPVYEDVDTIVALGAAIHAASAGGLILCNEKRTERIRLPHSSTTFQYSSTTSRWELKVRGTAERLLPDPDTGAMVWRPAAKGTVEICGDAIPEEDADIGKDGEFAFSAVALDAHAVRLTLRVLDHESKLLYDAGFVASRQMRQDVPPPVLPKELKLQVSSGGRKVMTLLMAKLTPLPNTATHVFAHPGTSVVDFPVYQDRRQIQVISVPVPPMPEGTPVTLTVTVDKLSFITVAGSIGATTFGAAVKAPPPRAVPDDEEINSLEARFESATDVMNAAEKRAPQLRWHNARKALDNALMKEARDGDAIIHNFEELEAIVDYVEDREVVLSPPKAEFDKLVETCLRMNREHAKYAPKEGIPHDEKETEASILLQRRQGEAALADRNQPAYSEAHDALQAIRKHLRNAGPSLTTEERAVAMLQWVSQKIGELAPVVEASKAPDAQKHLASLSEMRTQIPGLIELLERNPSDVAARASAMNARLTDIEKSLNMLNLSMDPDQAGKRLVRVRPDAASRSAPSA